MKNKLNKHNQKRFNDAWKSFTTKFPRTGEAYKEYIYPAIENDDSAFIKNAIDNIAFSPFNEGNEDLIYHEWDIVREFFKFYGAL